jgi:hypothetical protein
MVNISTSSAKRPRVTVQCLGAVVAALYLLQYLVFLHFLTHSKQYSYLSNKDDPELSQRTIVPIDLESEIQKSIEYVHSIKDTKRKLYFVHIPKTAGTTIEEVGGLQAELAWGSCRFNHKPKRPGKICQYPPGQFEWPTKIGWWHLPPHFFPLLGSNPYENADLFAIVRDPIDRLLSEFYYVCRKEHNINWHGIDCNRSRIHEPAYLNEWLQDKLQTIVQNRSSAETYLFDNGHYTPQYDFVVTKGKVRTMDYVLRMKDMGSEFHWLMKAYGINATLPKVKSNAARNDTHDLTVEHLDGTTMALVEQLYQNDWSLFPTKKVSA